MTTDAVGGVWTYACDLAAAMAPLGVATTLAVLGPPPDRAQREQAEGLGLDLVELGGALDWLAGSEAELRRAGEAVAALAAHCGAEIVHLNSPALAVVAMPCPVLGACHSCLATWWGAVRSGPMPPDFAWRSTLLTQGYAGCDVLVAPSHAFAVATAQAHALRLPPSVVHNGRAKGARAQGMAAFVFTAGRLWDEGKDVATLDRAAARLDLPLLAAGALVGPHGDGISLSHARALGSLNEAALRAWLARGPIFASAARYEPFGLAVLEAAQAGCALVLSDIPTFRELWDGAALFVPPGDDAGFAAAIGTLSRDGEQRRSVRVAALHRSRRYGVEAMARRMAAIHARLRGMSAGSPGRSAAA
ncbi:glycosyl transferase family 1 [Falsiroseomonas bella]|uniref:Glycosyl transferase family 1 n=2 Tax=Falsiroseomonas bella TaxID=2184016 RepID=A0A317FH36_9PROT|nr:glycosyl transferase family 1 [Falsiroseomonas bella]